MGKKDRFKLTEEMLRMQRALRVLGVAHNGNMEMVSEKFKEMARRYHPDTSTLNITDGQKVEKFQDAYEAYRIIREHCQKNGGKINLPKFLFEQRRTGNRSEDARGAFMRGIALMRTKNYLEAADVFRKAIEIIPTQAEFHSYLCMSLARAEANQTEAEQAGLKAINLDSQSGRHYFHLGYFYHTIGLKQRAEATLKMAMQLDPTLVPQSLKILNAPGRGNRRSR